MLGRHCILECYDCEHDWLKNQDSLEEILKQSALESGATVLHSYFHKFDKGEGVTGVIALSESHISVHTWPEHGYMAIDIFMCGDCDPQLAADFIISNVNIGAFSIDIFERGNEVVVSQ